MGRKIKVWLDSGANIHSCFKQTVDLDDLGYPEEEWAEMSDEEKDDAMRDIAFERSDWGWSEEDN